MDKIRVLYLITDLGKGGAERSIIDLAMEFNAFDDLECVIGTLYPQNDFQSIDDRVKIINLDYKVNSIFKKSYTLKYHNLVKEFEPNIIHSNRFLAEFLTSEKIYPKIVYVCHCRDNMIQFSNLSFTTIFSKRRILNFYEKRILVQKKYKKTPTYFVANSKHTKSYFERVLPRKLSSNVEIIYNGINLEKFSKKRKSHENGNPIIKIVNVGSFQEKKNQTFLIDIALELEKRKVEYEIHMLGTGLLLDHVQKKIIKHGLFKKIQLHGKVDNVEDYLEQSNLYVHVARYEPFGIVLLEAMAMGLPIVSLDGQGNKEIVKDYYNGFFIEKEDPSAFADRIIEISDDKQLYSTLSRNALEFVKKFDISKKALEYYDYYKKLLASSDRLYKL